MQRESSSILNAPPIDWSVVPQQVQQRYKQASDIKSSIVTAVDSLPKLQSGYGQVYWNPTTKALWLVSGDGDSWDDIKKWLAALRAIDGVTEVTCEAEYEPRDTEAWIKVAGALTYLDTPYQWLGKVTGGPSPLSNSIVSGLIGGSLGYAAGTAAEQLLPERYFDRGRLRRILAGAGAAGGSLLHVPQWAANAGINQTATGKPNWLRSLLRGDDSQQMSPHELKHLQSIGALKKQSEALDRASRELATLQGVKTADSGIMGAATVALRPVPVDAFNRAIWNDVHNGGNSSQANAYGTRSVYSDNSDAFGTPPVHAAAAAGLVTGIQQLYGRPPLLSTSHFVKGLAAAGVDGATAMIAGRVLGTLGGMTPAAQQRLQSMGLWGGMIRGVTGSVLGLH